MNIYLDIDGVLLDREGEPARHLREFLKYVTDTYTTYWLTNHCKGDASHTIFFLKRILPPETLEIAKKIKPTNWENSKTEAINFDEPFLWFDDLLFDNEIDSLNRNNAMNSWIEVNLDRNPDQLKYFVENFPLTK